MSEAELRAEIEKFRKELTDLTRSVTEIADLQVKANERTGRLMDIIHDMQTELSVYRSKVPPQKDFGVSEVV